MDPQVVALLPTDQELLSMISQGHDKKTHVYVCQNKHIYVSTFNNRHKVVSVCDILVDSGVLFQCVELQVYFP